MNVDSKMVFGAEDIMESDVLIYSVSYAGNAYGRDARSKNEGSIFFNQTSVGRFDLKPGDVVRARYVPNYPDRAELVPWRAIFVFDAAAAVPAPLAPPLPLAPPAPVASVASRVRQTMMGGGVWTVSSLLEALFPGKARAEASAEYNAISAAVRGMFAKGECAKFQLWRTPDQSKPGREWFTCFPEKADVDEWEDK
jgi:hypothetical protein